MPQQYHPGVTPGHPKPLSAQRRTPDKAPNPVSPEPASVRLIPDGHGHGQTGFAQAAKHAATHTLTRVKAIATVATNGGMSPESTIHAVDRYLDRVVRSRGRRANGATKPNVLKARGAGKRTGHHTNKARGFAHAHACTIDALRSLSPRERKRLLRAAAHRERVNKQ